MYKQNLTLYENHVLKGRLAGFDATKRAEKCSYVAWTTLNVNSSDVSYSFIFTTPNPQHADSCFLSPPLFLHPLTNCIPYALPPAQTQLSLMSAFVDALGWGAILQKRWQLQQ